MHGGVISIKRLVLAVQQSNWQAVTVLLQQLSSQGFLPTDKTEWLPFIEALIHSGDLEGAVIYSNISLEQEGARPVICGLWNKLARDPNNKLNLEKYLNQVGCN